MNTLGHGQADLVNIVQLLNRRPAQTFQRTKMPCEDSGGALADVSNAETVNQMPEIARLAGFDLRQHVRSRLLSHSFERSQIVQRQVVKIGDVFDYLFGDQLIGQRKADQ